MVEEAVYSFLNQDYEGDKELLILNDFDRQVIVFDHPQVTVINVPSRFHTVGEKRNAAVAMCRHDLLAVWDDDDIFLPHRLTFSVSKYDEKKRYFKPSLAFSLNNGVVSGPNFNLYHSSGMWRRSLFDEVGGYAHTVWGEDTDLEVKFKTVLGADRHYDNIKPSEIFYLYRWLGTQSYHSSSLRDRPGGTKNEKVGEYARRQLEQGKIQSGEIVLQPRWYVDYSQLVNDYVATLPCQDT
jgi:hypothetical protein